MKWVNRLSLRNRLLVSFLLVAMVPLLTFQTVFLQFLQNRAMSQEREAVKADVEQIAADYESLFDRVMLSADNLSQFRLIETYLNTAYPTRIDAYSYYISNIHPLLDIGGTVENGVKVCVHHGRTEVPLLSEELHSDLDVFLKKFPDIQNGGGWHVGTRWSYEPTSVPLRYLLPVYSVEQYLTLEWIIDFQLTEAALAVPLRSKHVDGLAFLTTADGSVLAAGEKRFRDDNLTQGLKTVMPLLQEEQPPEIELDGTDYLVFAQPVQEFWVLYLMAADNIQQDYNRTTGLYLTICLLVLTLMILIIRWTAESLAAGIRRLSDKMRSFDRASIKRLAAEPADRRSRNEVDQLDAVFTDMMSEIDHLVTTVGQQEIALRDQIIARQEVEISRIDAESRALQHQINPHYLFNTLEAIRMKLILKDDRETAEIIRLFAESFRRYMEDHETFVPLKEELEFVEKFVRIQNYRFEDMIRYESRVDPDLLTCPILKLMLQPLVENAILHGLAVRDQVGTVRLVIEKEGDQMEILVEDDGNGMTPEEVDALLNRIRKKQDHPSSVGLPNIVRRVRLVYGEQASLTITSKPEQGTQIRLRIPWKE